MSLWISLTLLLAATLRGGWCVFVFSNPENNTEVVQFSGAVNVSFECQVENENGEPTPTQWHILNFNGVVAPQIISVVDGTVLEGNSTIGTDFDPFFTTFQTRLTFPVFREDFHLTTLACGLPGGNPTLVIFPLRVYGAPRLVQDKSVIRFQEGANVEVNLEAGRSAFPFPEFEWRKDNMVLSSNVTGRRFGYPSFSFNPVARSDSGTYTLSATNFLLEDPSLQLGNDTTTFDIDVLYAPSLTFGPAERAVLLGTSLNLLCGTELDSNPNATVMWTDPEGMEVMNNARYTLINNQDEVRLLFDTTIASDMGVWTCRVRVEGRNVTTESGDVTDTLVGTPLVHMINLTLVEAPGQPSNLSVDSIGPTWVSLCWQAPTMTGRPGITRYDINVTNLDTGTSSVTMTMDSTPNFNMTGLLPNTQYEFTVQAVAVALDVEGSSDPSEAARGTTLITVPALVCESAMSVEGGLRLTWSFMHMGGQPLTNLTVIYISQFFDFRTIINGPEVGLDATMVDIPPVEAGLMYTGVITATNMNGSTEAQCETVQPNVGIPRTPEMPRVEELGGGTVRVSVRTVASGLESGGTMTFLLTQTKTTTGATDSMERSMDVPNYESGDLATFEIEDLDVGSFYTFEVRARNRFGTSMAAISQPIQITGVSPTTPAPTDSDSNQSNGGAIAGGIIGALIIVLLIVVVVVAVILIYLKFFRKLQTL